MQTAQQLTAYHTKKTADKG